MDRSGLDPGMPGGLLAHGTRVVELGEVLA
jgi:hypothetical protein